MRGTQITRSFAYESYLTPSNDEKKAPQGGPSSLDMMQLSTFLRPFLLSKVAPASPRPS